MNEQYHQYFSEQDKKHKIVDLCAEGPYIFSWLVAISNSVNEFFVAV